MGVIKGMIQKIVDTFVDRQLENNAILAEDKEIYRYGYILLIEVILNLLIALIIGLFSGEIWNILFFLCTYIPLRSFCGGWHAAKLWKCTVISSIIILVQVYVIKEIFRDVSLILLFLYFLLNMLLVFLIAPVDTKAKRISNDERRIYKAKINRILMVHLIIAVLMAKFEFREFLLSIMYVYTIQSVMLLLEIVRHKILNS